MRWIIVFFLLIPSILNAQIDSIKHVEVVSEIQDSMVLLQKSDVDKINKTFFEKNQLDSLNTLNEKIIFNLEQVNSTLDSIIVNQQLIIENHAEIENSLTKELEECQDFYDRSLKKERRRKIGWQTGTGIGILTILLILLI